MSTGMRYKSKLVNPEEKQGVHRGCVWTPGWRESSLMGDNSNQRTVGVFGGSKEECLSSKCFESCLREDTAPESEQGGCGYLQLSLPVLQWFLPL
ncbi:UNVERIFIED_CONTAM: hypothetical protein K2H54_019865 [Gekko kuhli]